MIAAADDGPTTEQILAAVDAVQDEAIDFLRSIVSIDSTLDKGEGRVQDAVYDHLVRVLGDGGVVGGGAVVAARKRKSAGGYGGRSFFEVTRQPVRIDDIRHRKGYSPVDWDYDDDQKFNVVARYPGRGRDHRGGDDDDGRDRANRNNDAVLLVGHVDVVPASASDGWTDDPFSPVVRNGRMYGRGAGDMKAGVVAMVYAIVALRDLGYAPGGGGVTICTVIEEECTGNGALASLPASLAAHDEDGAGGGMGRRTAVIIPEPFPWIVTAQLGVLWLTATVTGRPCHVLSTSSGSNAIEGAYAIYDSLRSLEAKYNEPGGGAHPAYRGIDHPVNFNLGRISGGNWASSVPSKCEFEVRVGFFPGVNMDDVKRDVETAMRGKATELGLGLDIRYRGFHADGAVLLPEYIDGIGRDDNSKSGVDDDGGSRSLQRDFVETIWRCNRLAASSSSTGDGGGGGGVTALKEPPGELELRPVTCTTDARFYSSLFQDPSKVVVTCYGPEATNIHGVDESVSLESIRDVMATIALFVRDWCGLFKDE
jgi:acetylornithine deacetylase